MHAHEFAAAFTAAVKYNRGLDAPDAETINGLLQQIHDDESLRNHRDYDPSTMPLLRKVAADALRDAGRNEEADLMADHTQRVRITNKYKVKPAHDQVVWPGGGETVHYLTDGGDYPVCANCANALDPEGREDVRWSAIHEEGPSEECSHCNHVIPALYGDPDNPDADE